MQMGVGFGRETFALVMASISMGASTIGKNLG